jgi:hypothetical protein
VRKAWRNPKVALKGTRAVLTARHYRRAVDVREASEAQLASCHGFIAVAGDRIVGLIETPLFPGAESEPDYLVIRTTRSVPGVFRMVPCSLVERIDVSRRRLELRAHWSEVAALPERLPLARR